MSRTVVIVGGGPGGVATARALRQYLAREDRIILVDRHDEQRLGVTFLLIMRGWGDPQDLVVKPSRLLAGCAEVVRAEVRRIDHQHRILETSEGTLTYDALVLAPGAELVPEIIPGLVGALENGVAGHCWSLSGALQLRERLRCFPGGRILIIIARLPYKCPPAPYEAALLVRDLAEERGISSSVDITVITPEPSPLAVAGPVVGQRLTNLLASRGILVRTGEQLTAIDARHREARFASGERELFDFALVVPPHRAPTVTQEAGLTDGEWIGVDRTTMRTAVDGIWALGDVAAIRIRENVMVPKAAVFAQQQAEAAARDIARWFGYSAPEPRLTATGRCWFLAGREQAGYVEGDFLTEPRPSVVFEEPTAAGYTAMQQEIAAWLAQDPLRGSEVSGS